MRDLSWMDDGDCRGLPTEWFFPERGDSEALALGRATCMECPVQARCYDYGIERREQKGLWGSLSAREREELIGRRFNLQDTDFPADLTANGPRDDLRITSHGFSPPLESLDRFYGLSPDGGSEDGDLYWGRSRNDYRIRR